MCGISGFYNRKTDFLKNQENYQSILENMCQVLNHRGPDASDTLLQPHCGLAHTRLSIIDLESGCQPMTRKWKNSTYTICYNGEIYNANEWRNKLLKKGFIFSTTSDTEVILLSFIAYGPEFVKELNGIFAFVIYDHGKDCLYGFRDHCGVKPFYFTFHQENFVFASEIKGIFCFPDIKPQIDETGLCEIFGTGPAKRYGSGVFKGILELKPGHYFCLNEYEIHFTQYFRLCSHPHEDSYESTLEKTRFLVTDAIRRQMVSDVPICTFLSGGIDSSVVSGVCAMELAKTGKQLNTFSFDFAQNNRYFKSNDFQPTQDAPFVAKMVKHIHSNHRYLECDYDTQAKLLYPSVESRDLPTMADVDSSLLYFCSEVKQYNKVVLTGECADEIFGGYPWFHKEEFLNSGTFPWTPDLTPRTSLLRKDLLAKIHLEEYVQETYKESIKEIAVLPEDSEIEANRRRISYLNQKWFMQTLLDRMDRTSMYSGLEARVPFADYRIVAYMFNVPWEMKAKDGMVKHLLRQSCRGLIPDEILFRRKSPYPKTYDPHYENLLSSMLIQVLQNPKSPIHYIVDKGAVMQFLKNPKDYGKPWYGQLMAGPQMIAYLLQVNYWLEHYQIDLCVE